MKLDGRSLNNVTKENIPYRAFLFYGENQGLVRDLAQKLITKIVGQINDPFLVSILTKENHYRFLEEANSLSLVGGQRVVWIRESTDALTKELEILFKHDSFDSSSDTILVLEAETLSPRSSLRQFAEKNQLIACVPCYKESPKSLADLIKTLIYPKHISQDAQLYLLNLLNSDTASVKNEIEKLLLYIGIKNTITLEDIQQAIGDEKEFNVEDIALATMSGQLLNADKAFHKALYENTAMIVIVRNLLYYTNRLLRARLLVEHGMTEMAAITKLSPPLFFRQKEDFLKALNLWRSKGLLEMQTHLQKLEFLIKQSSIPTELLCQNFILTITRHALHKKNHINKELLFSNL
ncbi:hypothetical protein COMNV_00020 [Commensalibacter sp. Nvir]|uniref:DNA polymerase III subunit delta n=1 Tax=Commensalibacter sp. Nvir TaxID=3069817 RepID=UPI002D356B8C|nr:hypothetical protein COMNV_00020 [Commensalibacter sp. Nvir]